MRRPSLVAALAALALVAAGADAAERTVARAVSIAAPWAMSGDVPAAGRRVATADLALVRAAPSPPAAARAGSWRTGARPPGDVPASTVVRAALRSGPARARPLPMGAGSSRGESPTAIEIVWHAPGS